jgi:hypothetical protein
MSCLLAMMRLTELTTFIAHAPTSDTAGAFFSASMAPRRRFPLLPAAHSLTRTRRGEQQGSDGLVAGCWSRPVSVASCGRGRWVIIN